MSARNKWTVCLTALWLVLCLASHARTDVAKGDLIDKSNWQKSEGLLPDSVLDWVRAGQYTIPVGELEYPLRESFPNYVLEHMDANATRYTLNEEDEIVDTKTGKVADEIVGLPFPKIDPEDPKAAVKIIYNGVMVRLCQGSGVWPGMLAHYINRSRIEKDVDIHMKVGAYIGYPQAKEVANPDRLEEQVLFRVNTPYDLAGTAVLLWRYLGAKQDVTFGYVPAIRRVRRMSPANRSDAMFGSDFSVDDAGYAGYDGKVPYFNWRLVGQGEVLGMFGFTHRYPARRNEKGEVITETQVRPLKYGFNSPGWAGAIWAPLNVTYVKRPVYIIECEAKDPFYNYGKQTLWVDKEIYCGYYKKINDHSGEYWKTWYNIWAVNETPDKTFRIPYFVSVNMIDEKAEHATVFELWNEHCPSILHSKEGFDMFSLAGFQAFCK